MWQQFAVLAIVAASAGYAVWSLLPPVTRWRLRSRVSEALGKLPAPVAALALRLLRPAAAPGAAGCAACPAAAAHKAPAPRR